MTRPLQTRPLAQDMVRFGYLATRVQLRALGHTSLQLQRASADHIVWPIGRSWLAHPGADHAAMRAVALHGRLAASSALASHGVWVTRSSGLWVGTATHASRPGPVGPNEHRLWVREQFPDRSDQRWRVSVADSLLQLAQLGPSTDAADADLIASTDSALRQRLLTPDLVDVLFAAMPRRVRRLQKRLNARADSGLETLMRLAAEDEGWNVQIQIVIDRVGRVDMVIDGWLVIELDGKRWHDDDSSWEGDARRDAELILLGYRYHRFRHSQVLNEMPMCLAVIRTILASGRPVVAA